MLIGVLLILFGILLFFVNPILGAIPGLLFILLGLVVVVLGGMVRGAGAVFGLGPKRCPECRSKIDGRASVCRYCGYRFGAP